MPVPKDRIARWFAALVAIFYGFAKLNGAQFTIIDSELDKPMGMVSGFWLTWYYFGYSAVYSSFIACVQIAGGVALTFRRSALLGACCLLPLFANIVLIDVFYAVDVGATVIAFVVVLALLAIVHEHREELLEIFWRRRTGSSLPVAAWALRIALVFFAAGATYWTANYNNRDPTPLDGAWNVAHVTGNLTDAPAVIFFEHNRAYLCVLKSASGTYQSRHFAVDTRSSSIGIWEHWLNKGSRIFEGHYTLSGTELTLAGQWMGQPVQFEMKRR